MEHKTNDSEAPRIGSFGRISSTNSSRRHSFNMSVAGHPHVDNDSDSRSVSEAGDIGDRALSIRRSGSGLSRLSIYPQIDDDIENRSISEAGDIGVQAHSKSHSGNDMPRFSIDSLGENTIVSIPEAGKQLEDRMVSLVCGEEKKEDEGQVPWQMKYVSCLAHLAVFGILGVLTRYLLEKLFGPGIVGATSDKSYMYLDLPPNMVGSFLMGWFGVVFKRDISNFSEELAVGLSTGYLGSLTTFSGWNQKMLELSIDGHWVFSILGFILGLFLVAYSFIFGVETAEGFRWTCSKVPLKFKYTGNRKVDDVASHTTVLVVVVIMLGLLGGLSIIFVIREFSSYSSGTQLWLGCLVGPIGVFIRFYLARLNGQGLGRGALLKWVPFGTLIANVVASCLMAALATTKKAVNNKNCNIMASGFQFGFCGCLSTVSTFIAEFGAMRQSKHPWRAYAYALMTIAISFCLGTLVYSVPVWTKGYG